MNVKLNRTSKVLGYLIDKSKNSKIDNNIKNYISQFININF